MHATRLAEELDALSAKDVQRVFGLPINLARKLLEMMLYRDLIQESKKRKSRLLNREGGFLFEEDSEESKRHRKDPIFDQMFELTEAGRLASKDGEIRPIVSMNKTLYMVEETGEFLPINTSLSGEKWDKINWKMPPHLLIKKSSIGSQASREILGRLMNQLRVFRQKKPLERMILA